MPPIIAAATVATAAGTTVAGFEAAREQERAAIDAQQKAETVLGDAGERAREDVQAAEARAQTALQAGRAGAREDIQAGTTAATDPLQQLADTRAIQTADVVSGSKLGELFAEGFDFEASPGFQFRREQGEKALGRAAAARGGRSSGRLAMELAEFNSGLASQEFGQAFDRRFRGAQAVDALASSQAGRQDVAGLQAQGLGAGGLSRLAQLFSGEGQNLAGINQSTAAALAQLPIADVTIEEPPVEEIIREVFRRGKDGGHA